MQMTYDQAMRPGLLTLLAARRRGGYVMRSEKRPGYGGGSGGSAGQGGKKPRRPRKAGFFYILMTLIISLILWPIGMVMLWRRKVRMQAGTKLLISLLTLCISVFLIVFVLTVHVDNERFTAYQDKANDWLDNAAVQLSKTGDTVYKKSVEAWSVMTEFVEDVSQPALNTLADGIDKGVEGGRWVRNRIIRLTGGEVEEPMRPTDTREDGTPLYDDALNVRLPDETPEPGSGKALEAGMLGKDGSISPGVTPNPTATPAPGDEAGPLGWRATASPTPVPTPTPTPEPVLTVTVKPAADAVVYYNDTGKLYHMQKTCSGMKTADEHTLAEAVEAGKKNCSVCGSPDASMLDEPYVVWADADSRFHTSSECEKFNGEWRLISLNDAINTEHLSPCADCEADIYAALNAKAAPIPTPTPKPSPTATPVPTPTPKPTATPTPTPTPSPSPTPAPVVIVPSVTLKPAAAARVYRSSNGKFYHKVELCKGMTGSSPYLLSDVAGQYKQCNTCQAPSADLIGQPCLWVDESNICHTTDACARFNGTYTLMVRDEALEKGLVACPDCGANEYLVPNTVIAD